jgi:cytochrome c biogenesis protein CcmG, thiol:disulfide interchange protein DsbE
VVNFVQRLRASLCLALFLGLAAPAASALAVGDPVPDFRLPGLLAKGELSKRHLLGRVIYLDFWASWCGPCRKSMPVLDGLYRELGDRGFAVVAINMDSDLSEAHRFLQRYPVSYPLLKDNNDAAMHLFKVSGLPSGFLLDRDGRIRLLHRGFREGDEDKLRREVLDLLE